jgi:hypothetical protein
MQNVEWEIKGDKLIVEIDLTKEQIYGIRTKRQCKACAGFPFCLGLLF